MMRNLRKLLITVSAGGFVLAAMGPAFAEGSFNSHLSLVRVGFNSRTWTDMNSDANSTNIRLSGCTTSYPFHTTTKLQLTQEQPFPFPDINRGVKSYPCPSGGTDAWGRQPRSNYHFTVVEIAGQGDLTYTLSATGVTVWY